MNSVSVLAAACVAAIVASAAPAAEARQEPRIGQAQVYRSLLHSDMTALLNSRSYASVKKADGGRYDIETADGFKFSVELTVCDVEGAPAGCLGVSVYATWGMAAGDRAKLSSVIDRFNNQYRIGKAMLLEESVYAERYVTTDGGVTLEHVTAELDEFESAMVQLVSLMQEALGV